MLRSWVKVAALMLLLVSCRPVWLPLDPVQPTTHTVGVATTLPTRAFGKLIPNEDTGKVALELSVLNLGPEAGYLELRWFKEDQLYQAKSVWLEGDGDIKEVFDRFDQGYYRLTALWKRKPILQLDVGTPFVPNFPEPK